MTDEMESAKKAEILALKEETQEKRKRIYESYGLSYPPKFSNVRDGTPIPPEINELEQQTFLKYMAIQEKYKK